MTEESLDNLLADRALGALSSDTAALLEAYLTHDPEGRKKAAEMEAVASLARRALAREEPKAIVLPPLKLKKTTWASAGRIAAAATGMAACVILGFLWGRARPAEGVVEAVVTTNRAIPPAVQTADAGAGVQDFWSIQRLRRYAARQPIVERPTPMRKALWTPGLMGG
jgi:hypothetical protein